MCEMCNLKKFLEKPRSDWAVLNKVASVYRDLEMPLPDRIIPMLEKAAKLRKSIGERKKGLKDDELDLVVLYASIRALLTYGLKVSPRESISQSFASDALDLVDILEQVIEPVGICMPTVSRLAEDANRIAMADWLIENPDQLEVVVKACAEYTEEPRTIN